MRMLIPFLLAGCVFAAGDDQEAKNLPDGAGKEVVAKVCLSCHGAGNFRQMRKTKDEWTDQVGDMIDKGAEATDEQQAVIVAYLSQNFGPDSKINVNTAPFEEIKRVLVLTAKETQAFVDYRKQNGAFKAVAELDKIPGVPPDKIDAKKDQIAF
ncbi:MAG TPA: helix-hairpin-helix domain-containing protein [Bryobacteraceae bacterium]|nr:helix-hairpin-helix domain-containing protein [Bryobacteraceae bacterium]